MLRLNIKLTNLPQSSMNLQVTPRISLGTWGREMKRRNCEDNWDIPLSLRLQITLEWLTILHWILWGLIVFFWILESTERKESLNEWKETEKWDWDTVESNYSYEGGEIDSIDRNNLIGKNKIMSLFKIQIDRIVPYWHAEFLSRQTFLQNSSPTTKSQIQNLNRNYQRETPNNLEKLDLFYFFLIQSFRSNYQCSHNYRCL